MDRTHFLYSAALRYFAAVAEFGSIRAAARNLNIASSAVNRQILWLEDALGVQVFERIGRRLQLSAAGTILLRHVRETLTGFEAAVEEIDALRGLQRGTVKIATVESISEAILPDIIGRFRRRYPDIHLDITVISADRVARIVEDAEADMGITFNPKKSDFLEITSHQSVPLGAVVAGDHPLAEKDAVTLADCLDYPVALPGRGLSIRTSLDRALTHIAKPLKVYLEANSLRLLKSVVREGACVGFQTAIGLEYDLARGELAFRKLADSGMPDETLAVICRSGRDLSLAPAVFFDHVLSRIDRYSTGN